MAKIIVLLILIASSLIYVGLASDQQPLQDFCIGDPTSPVTLNGLPCKNPALVTADDISFSGLDKAGEIDRFLSNANVVDITKYLGINTLGISMTRVDIVPGGINRPHFHPRASEVITILQGTVLAGFVTSNPENKLFSKILHKGDVFVFPKGLVHFQHNIGSEHVVALNFLNSQYPGGFPIAETLFGTNPPIDSEILVRAFQVDKKTAEKIQSKFQNRSN